MPTHDLPPTGIGSPFDRDPNIQNVQALVDLHAKSEHDVTHHQRRIEGLTARLGRPKALHILLGAALLWIGVNLLAPLLGWKSLDPPPFYWMQGLVGLLALLMTNMVLITQQRQGKMAARRTLLDLHVNLLSEQKLAKLIALLEELRRDLPSVYNRPDPQAEVMSRPLDPQVAIATLEQQIEQAMTAGAGEAAAPASPSSPPSAKE